MDNENNMKQSGIIEQVTFSECAIRVVVMVNGLCGDFIEFY